MKHQASASLYATLMFCGVTAFVQFRLKYLFGLLTRLEYSSNICSIVDCRTNTWSMQEQQQQQQKTHYVSFCFFPFEDLHILQVLLLLQLLLIN